jgi:3-isopropylmalate dehydrogenase
MEKTIAVLEGDGIGPEIMNEGIKVLLAVSEKYRYRFKFSYPPFGAGAYFKHGHPFPEKTKKACDEADTILKGPIGLAVSEMEKIPQEMRPEVAALLLLRKRYDTYANYRPVVLPKGCFDFSPLRPERLGNGLDILMMRELVGGIYFGKKVEGKDTGMQYASDDCTYTREQVDRFAHVCFKEARKRQSKLTNVHKKNVLATSRFWNARFREISKQYPDVKLEEMLVDDVACQLVRNPAQFNGVMAFENMQGDIITDLGGGILGSLGLMPSACLNPETGRGYFEPAHGSAPDIAGQNKANPYSMIGSVAFMLEKAFGLEEEAKAVWNALTEVFGQGYRTGELAGPSTPQDMILSTSQFGDKVVEVILK